MKSIVAIFFLLNSTYALAVNDPFGFSMAGDLLEQLKSEIEMPEILMSQEMHRAYKTQSFEMPVTTDEPCTYKPVNFADQLQLSVDPTKACHDMNTTGWTDRDEFCGCMANASVNILDVDNYKEILNKIVSEAEKKQNYYVNTTFQLLKDKVLSSLEASNKYGRDVGLTCSPSSLISNFNKATKDCSPESIKKVDEMTRRENVFNLLNDNFRDLNNEFKAKEFNKAELENNKNELVKLLDRVYRHNKKLEKIPNEELNGIDEKIQALLKQNPLLRKFQVKIARDNEYDFNLKNYNPMYGASIRKPDLFEEMAKSRYGILKTNLEVSIGDKETERILHLSDIKTGVNEILEHEINQQNQFCSSIKATVAHICQSATSIDTTIQSIQQDPMHMSKIVMDIMGDEVYGEEIFNKRYNSETAFSFNYEPNFIGISRPLYADPKKFSEAYSSRKMIDAVSSLQCTFVLPNMIGDFIPGILVSTDTDNNVQRFGEIAKTYGAFNSRFVGRIGDYDPDDLLYNIKTYDPYAFMSSATSWSKELAQVARDENQIKTVDSVGISPIFDWRGLTMISNKSKVVEDSPSPSVGTGGTTVSDINELRERANQNTPSASKETEAEIDNTPALETPSVGITNLPQVGLPTMTQKAAQSSTEEISNETPTPEANPLADYEMRMQEMMAQMAVLTAKSAQLANQSKGKNEDEEADEEKDELKQTIAGLQAEIDDLAKKKKEVSKVTKQESKPTTIGITPFKSANQSAPAKSNTQKVAAVNKQAAPAGASRAATTMSSSQSAMSSPSISSASNGKGFSSQSSSRSDFALNAESVNLEGKFTISAKDFKTSDQKILSDLYKKANGQPIYVTEKLPDGTEEVVMYEAVKEEDGTIKYVPKKIKDLLSIDKVKQKKTKGKAKKEAKKRKRTKVEDLNKLIDQNK